MLCCFYLGHFLDDSFASVFFFFFISSFKNWIEPDGDTVVKCNTLGGRLTWESFQLMSEDLPEYARHVCAHNLGLAEAGGGLWQKAPVRGAVSLSFSLTLSLSLMNKKKETLQNGKRGQQ